MALTTWPRRGLPALLFWIIAGIAVAGEPPAIPVGLDAYRQWDRWPYQRIGARAYMRSTYDRTGGNEGADASHFLYQLADDFNVTLDVEGRASSTSPATTTGTAAPGITRWTARTTSSQESSSADPVHPRDRIGSSCPMSPFPNPLDLDLGDRPRAPT